MANCGCSSNSTTQPCCQDCVSTNPCNSGCLDIVNAACVEFTGEDIEALGIETNDKLDTIIIAIGEVLDDIAPGSYEDFDYGCLSILNITNRQDFVESTASLFCQIMGSQTPGSITSLSSISASIQTLQTTVNNTIDTQTTIDDFEAISGLPGPTATATALFLALQQAIVNHDADIVNLTSLGAVGITAADSSTVDFSVSGIGNHTITADVKLSATANNAITAEADGLHTISPVISVTNTPTISFIVSGVLDHTLTGNVQVSGVAGNQITIQADGIYAPSTTSSETPIVATDSTTIAFTTGGTNDHDITADVIIDPDVNNILVDSGNGLFVDSSSLVLANNIVGDAQLRDSTAFSIMGRSAGTTGDPADIQASADGVLRRSGSGNLQFGTLVTGNIGNSQVTFAKVQNVSSSTLAGRSTAGTGSLEQLSLGDHLTISAGTIDTYGRTLIAVERFVVDGTWNKPTGCNAVLVYTVGGGGGGGGADADALEAAVGGAGGAGGGSLHFITAGLGSTETVTVGTAGAGGAVGTAYIGDPGTASSFGAHTGCDGGDGGLTLASGTTAALQISSAGGVPGVHLTGLVYNAQGATGSPGIVMSGTDALGGSSPGSIIGGGSSNAPGAGGAGAVSFNGTPVDGDDGIAGIVIVYSYS